MEKNKTIYTAFHKASALFMIMALLWLTVSSPYVMALQESGKHERLENKQSPVSGTEEKVPASNTEEKVPGGNNFSEEFLHELHLTRHLIRGISEYHKCENSTAYIAYHGELLVPPPDAV